MKKTLFLIFAFVIVACSSDEDNFPESIVGTKWKCEEVYIVDEINNKSDIFLKIISFHKDKFEEYKHIQISSAGAEDLEETRSGTYKYEYPFIYTYYEYSDEWVFRYKIDGNKLIRLGSHFEFDRIK